MPRYNISKPHSDRKHHGDAFAARASELADWTARHLVNRYDAWGAYYQGGQVTRYGHLSIAILMRHYQGCDVGDIIGLHTAGADNLSLGGALDIDQHGDDPARAEVNQLAALHWYDVLARQGFRPLLTASNGKGGYHLRILLAEPIDAVRLYHYLRHLTADHRQIGLDKPPEHFPKQPDVRKCAKGLGNWIRLSGRHHKRDYWSEIWHGSRWLAGHAAIDFMLSLSGDAPVLIPDIPPPTPPPPRKPLPRRTYHRYARNGLSARIAAYMSRLPNLSEGQGRDTVAFGFAAFLVRDLALDDDIALQCLQRWDEGNDPPKGEARLAEIIRSAHDYGRQQYGCGLPPDGHSSITFWMEVC
jgi:hypothetical protein